MYGFAGIDETNNKLKSLNENLDLDQGKGHYRIITQLKRKYPGLKVLLGVGGNADPNREIYLQLLESSGGRIAFINSAYTLLKTYDFDGLDLAWQFPTNKPKRIRSTLGGFWYSVKKTVGAAGKPLDERAEEHKEGFTALVRELKNAFRSDNYLLSLTVLPNVNSTGKFSSNFSQFLFHISQKSPRNLQKLYIFFQSFSIFPLWSATWTLFNWLHTIFKLLLAIQRKPIIQHHCTN